MGILAHIDRRAEFPEIDAGLIGQRVVASAIAMGRAA